MSTRSCWILGVPLILGVDLYFAFHIGLIIFSVDEIFVIVNCCSKLIKIISFPSQNSPLEIADVYDEIRRMLLIFFVAYFVVPNERGSNLLILVLSCIGFGENGKSTHPHSKIISKQVY